MTLDRAWAQAEEVLPEWWRIRSLIELRFGEWEVVAFSGNQIVTARGDTPQDAMRALAARFTSEVPA